MSETSHPHRQPRSSVPTPARVLAATILGQATHLDPPTLAAIIDAAAALTETGQPDAARILLAFAAAGGPDPDQTAAHTLAALHTPAPHTPGHPARPAIRPGDPAATGPGLDSEEHHPTTAYVQVLPLDQSWPDPAGRPVGIYTPVPVIGPPGWCDHLQGICTTCLPTWAEDHTIAAFHHGPDGAAAGCRCPTCTPTPKRDPDTISDQPQG